MALSERQLEAMWEYVLADARDWVAQDRTTYAKSQATAHRVVALALESSPPADAIYFGTPSRVAVESEETPAKGGDCPAHACGPVQGALDGRTVARGANIGPAPEETPAPRNWEKCQKCGYEGPGFFCYCAKPEASAPATRSVEEILAWVTTLYSPHATVTKEVGEALRLYREERRVHQDKCDALQRTYLFDFQ